MIAFFPELYEDELAYSWFSRYYTKSGYLSLRYALDDLYVKRYVNPDTEFVNELRPEVKELVIKHCGMEKLILGHTMFSSYGRFLPDAKKQEAYRALLDMNGNFNNLLAIPKNRRGTGRTLRYCPLCVKEDRKAYGETYWHRIHQIQGIQICGRHGCYLAESDVSMERKAAPGLWNAESVIPEELEVRMCEEEKEAALAGYACRIFEGRMPFKSRVSVAEFLKYRLKHPYGSASGVSLCLERLYQDYREFYGNKNVMTETKMQKILLGKRWNFYDICQLSMFAGIPVEELAAIPDSIADEIKEPVFMQVSEELGLDYELVRSVGEAVLRRYEARERVQRRKRTFAWEKMDEELIPKVRETIALLQGDGMTRPQRVTVSAVTKKMHLPDKRFEKLPRCREEIKEHTEPQKEYWAREAVWAYRKLVREGRPVNWTQIRRLTNMKNVDFQGCKPYLRKHAGEDADRLECLL